MSETLQTCIVFFDLLWASVAGIAPLLFPNQVLKLAVQNAQPMDHNNVYTSMAS
jgi:hypothetical protein